jgi:hypothetical protein
VSGIFYVLVVAERKRLFVFLLLSKFSIGVRPTKAHSETFSFSFVRGPLHVDSGCALVAVCFSVASTKCMAGNSPFMAKNETLCT